MSRFKRADKKTGISVSIRESVFDAVTFLSEKYGVTKSEIVESILLGDIEILTTMKERGWDVEKQGEN